VPELAGVDDLQVAPLPGGLSNRNYLAGDGDTRFVIRVAGDNGTLLGADRAREKAVLGIVEAAGITPPVAAFILPDGHSATRYLSEAHSLSVEEFTSPVTVPRLAAILRRVHGLGRVDGVFDPFADIARWMEMIEAKGDLVAACCSSRNPCTIFLMMTLPVSSSTTSTITWMVSTPLSTSFP
jgi:aminoglycoside phosphotransferase (APT) family kinase protein